MRQRTPRRPSRFGEFAFYSHLRENAVIREDDSEEVIREKLERINSNYVELERVKIQKAEEIVHRLEIFSGQLTLTDVLETPLPLLEQLEKAKTKIEERRAQAAKK